MLGRLGSAGIGSDGSAGANEMLGTPGKAIPPTFGRPGNGGSDGSDGMGSDGIAAVRLTDGIPGSATPPTLGIPGSTGRLGDDGVGIPGSASATDRLGNVQRDIIVP